MTEPLALPDASRPLHIVLEHRTGILKGLFQIVGRTDDPGMPNPLPTMLPVVERSQDGTTIAVNMVKVRKRALYYREILTPPGLDHPELPTFTKGQR